MAFSELYSNNLLGHCCKLLLLSQKCVSLQFDLTAAVSVANVEIKNKIQVFGLLERAEDAVNS